MRSSFAAICAGLLLASCSNPLSLLNPPSLVENDQTGMAIEAFLFATEDLAARSRFGPVQFQRDNGGMRRVVRSAIPLMPPDREKVPYSRATRSDVVTPAPYDTVMGPLTPEAYLSSIQNYISTGSDVAQLVCTEFMTNNYDRNQYFQFLRTELNTGVTLTQAVFQLARANATLKDSVANVFPVINTGLDAYQTFRYHSVDDVTIRPLVLAAMKAKTAYYVGQPLAPATSGKPAVPAKVGMLPVSFAGAVNAVNEIEYLCTRQGIAFLINHGVAATIISTDPDGAILFNPRASNQQ